MSLAGRGGVRFLQKLGRSWRHGLGLREKPPEVSISASATHGLWDPDRVPILTCTPRGAPPQRPTVGLGRKTLGNKPEAICGTQCV